MFRLRISLKWFLLGTAAIAVLLGMGKRYYDSRQWLAAPAVAGSREAFNPQKHQQWMARQREIREALRGSDIRSWNGYLNYVYILPRTDLSRLPLLREATELEEFGAEVPLADADLLWAKNHPNLRRIPHLAGISNDSLAIIGTCKKLEQVRIESSTITDDGLAHLRGLDHLEHFDLCKSPVTGRGLASLAHLPRLSQLRLSECPINDEGLKGIGQLRQLEMLDLCATKINGTGLAHLKMLPALRTLNLNSTILVDGRGWAQLDTVRNLGLYRVRLREGVLKGVAEMNSLESLLLIQSTVTDDLLSELIDAYQIRELNLEETTIGDGGLMHLAQLSSLRDLNLRNTRITDDGLVHLQSLKDLRLLNLATTAVTEAGVLRLAEALPNTRIHYVIKTVGPKTVGPGAK